MTVHLTARRVTYWQTEVDIVEPVVCIELYSLWQTGECIAVEFTLIAGENLHIIMMNLFA